ncbi:MAG: helix-turn-helix domain-containing protein [Subdoligranulum sp.]|nr:helix-turn-helix domain-containing protein [Subdoligranulum sp.]
MRNYETELRLETMRGMFLANQLYSWQLDTEFKLLYSNCPSEKFFYDLLIVSGGNSVMLNHFRNNRMPILLNDRMGFAWVAAAEIQSDTLTEIHLMGPVFTVEASESYLRSLCAQLHISAELSGELMQQMKLVPTVPLSMALRYAVMLQYCISSEQIGLTDIVYENTAIDPKLESEWSSTNWHGTWEAEQMMFEAIRTGTMQPGTQGLTDQFSEGRVGTMCPGDPLRQAKDELIVFAVLCSRAAILGGVSPEGGYNLADYYIQRGEACENINDVYACIAELQLAVVQRVQKCRQGDRSALSAACMEYVMTHILEKIRLDDLAQALGYSGYYLSKKFKAENGIALKDYINREKIEYAKRLLASPQASIVEISERLAFSSPSYFGLVFQEYTGMTPSKYQGTNIKSEEDSHEKDLLQSP